MEFFEYLKHLYRFKVWLLIGIILGSLAGATLASISKDQYQTIISLYIQRKTEEPSNQYFTYEGYYAQQTAVTHTDTVLRLLSTDEIMTQAAHLAGLDKTVEQVSALKSNIILKKESPQLIKVTVTMPSQQTAADLATGLSQAIKQRTVELNKFGDNSLSIEQVESEPLVATLTPSRAIYAAIGGVVGLVIALVASAIWTYASAQKRRK